MSLHQPRRKDMGTSVMDFIGIPNSMHLGGAPRDRLKTTSDRRDSARHTAAGDVLFIWHHEHEAPQSYPALDISEHGARIEVGCMMPEGMTGIAVAHRPSGTRIDRPAMVVWCRAVRDDRGILRHYEAGIRFF
jgi:hypothetical protein